MVDLLNQVLKELALKSNSGNDKKGLEGKIFCENFRETIKFKKL